MTDQNTYLQLIKLNRGENLGSQKTEYVYGHHVPDKYKD